MNSDRVRGLFAGLALGDAIASQKHATSLRSPCLRHAFYYPKTIISSEKQGVVGQLSWITESAIASLNSIDKKRYTSKKALDSYVDWTRSKPRTDSVTESLFCNIKNAKSYRLRILHDTKSDVTSDSCMARATGLIFVCQGSVSIDCFLTHRYYVCVHATKAYVRLLKHLTRNGKMPRRLFYCNQVDDVLCEKQRPTEAPQILCTLWSAYNTAFKLTKLRENPENICQNALQHIDQRVEFSVVFAVVGAIVGYKKLENLFTKEFIIMKQADTAKGSIFRPDKYTFQALMLRFM